MAEEKEPVKSLTFMNQLKVGWQSGFFGKVKVISLTTGLVLYVIGYFAVVYVAPLAFGYFLIGLPTHRILAWLSIDPFLFDWIYGVVGALATLATTRFVNSILQKQKAAQRLADERAQARYKAYLEEQARLKEAMTEAEWAIYSAQLETQKLLRQGQAAEARRHADSLRPQFGYFMNWPPKF